MIGRAVVGGLGAPLSLLSLLLGVDGRHRLLHLGLRVRVPVPLPEARPAVVVAVAHHDWLVGDVVGRHAVVVPRLVVAHVMMGVSPVRDVVVRGHVRRRAVVVADGGGVGVVGKHLSGEMVVRVVELDDGLRVLVHLAVLVEDVGGVVLLLRGFFVLAARRRRLVHVDHVTRHGRLLAALGRHRVVRPLAAVLVDGLHDVGRPLRVVDGLVLDVGVVVRPRVTHGEVVVVMVTELLLGGVVGGHLSFDVGQFLAHLPRLLRLWRL